MIFTKRFRYRFGDIDDAGIAYYPSFFHYFHCAFEDWWSDALHTPYDTVLHEEKFGLPAVGVKTRRQMNNLMRPRMRKERMHGHSVPSEMDGERKKP